MPWVPRGWGRAGNRCQARSCSISQQLGVSAPVSSLEQERSLEVLLFLGLSGSSCGAQGEVKIKA